ncbi:HTTM domain-containing protein [Halorussus lipolyticus]|uniref:HTTM domain-containing protein n=1 Tax=Halorussus lipolyticus TaxID=3034024 RepID=UPI0023E8C504|nr:HTTM domain-containing protein [Halorussus sp. DT80]
MNAPALPERPLARCRAAIARRFGVDARALAALRVSLGVLLLADLLLRSRDLVAFYADSGVLPRAVLREQFPAMAALSVHALSGSAWVQGALFLAAGGVAVALLVGYRTRLAALVSFALLVSLHARNPVVLNGGDSLLRRLLFWGMFLPLGRRWSVDALRAARERAADGRSPGSLSEEYERQPGNHVASVATAALLIQVVVVYTANALFKLRGDRWVRGDAIQYVFSLDQLIVGFGDVLARYPLVLGFFDRVWLGLLVSSVALVLLTGRRRTVFASLFVGMHLGMALTMRLGIFPLVSIAGLIPFLPRAFWDRATAKLRASEAWDRFDREDRRGRLDGLVSERNRRGPAEAARQIGRAKPPVVAGLLAFVLVWNAATLGYVAAPEEVESAVDPGEYRWDMFAPEPRGADGWYVVPGRLENDTRRDVFHGTAVRWDRPPDVADSYPNVRWFKYLMDLRVGANEPLRPHLAEYLCRRWNASHGVGVERLGMYYVEQPTRLEGPEPTHRIELLRYACARQASVSE